MFQITETTEHGDFHKVVIRAGVTMRAALESVLTESPYNSGMTCEHRTRISRGLVSREPVTLHQGWASYTSEFRVSLEDVYLSYLAYDARQRVWAPSFGIVVEDRSDTLVVRHPASAAEKVIDTSRVIRFR